MLLSFQTFAQDSDVNTFSYSSTAKISFVCLTIVVVLLIVVFAHYKNPAKTGFVWQIAGKQLAPTNVFIGRVLSCPWVFLIWLIFQYFWSYWYSRLKRRKPWLLLHFGTWIELESFIFCPNWHICNFSSNLKVLVLCLSYWWSFWAVFVPIGNIHWDETSISTFCSVPTDGHERGGHRGDKPNARRYFCFTFWLKYSEVSQVKYRNRKCNRSQSTLIHNLNRPLTMICPDPGFNCFLGHARLCPPPSAV